MRKSLVLFCLIVVSSYSLVEVVHNFERPKKKYSLFYPTENITGDTLVNLEYLSWGGGFKNITTVYQGRLLGENINKVRLDVYPDPHLDSIPVWYFKRSKNIIYRRTQDYPSPYSFWYFRDEWLGTISLISLLPLLIYYLKLRKK